MICSNCGTPLTDNAKFCTVCGTPMSAPAAPGYHAGAATYGLDSSSISTASGHQLQYVVLQVTLKEKFFGTGSGNLTELEQVINGQAAQGYRLHTISTATSHSAGLMGGDRIQATLVFEKI